MNLKSFIRPAVLKKEAYSVSDYVCPVKLNQNENPFDFPAEFKKEIEAEIVNSAWNRYPTVFPDLLIRKLSENLNISEKSILVGHGSNELIYSTLWAILEKNDTVLIPVPAFSLYESVADLCEANVIKITGNSETLQTDMDDVIAEVKKSKPKMTILCNPNNPSAQKVSVEKVIELLNVSTGLVWLDEAYIEFSQNRTLMTELNSFPNMIILRTFSKAYALAGLRLGFIAAHPDLIAEFKKTKVPFTVDQISQTIALKILERPELVTESVNRIKAEKSRFLTHFKQITAVKVFESDTNFFIFKSLSKDHKIIFKSLAESGVLVRDVSSYPAMEGCLRVTVGTPEENDEFLRLLKETV